MSAEMRPHALVTLALADPTDTLATLRDAESMMLNGGPNKVRLTALIDQIEAQTKPPKPAEPTGLGAVVEDAGGNRWTRARSHDHALNWRAEWGGNWKFYIEIDVVRVLSEGVTA